MLQTSVLLMQSINKTATPIFLFVVCFLFPKAIFLTAIIFIGVFCRNIPVSPGNYTWNSASLQQVYESTSSIESAFCYDSSKVAFRFSFKWLNCILYGPHNVEIKLQYTLYKYSQTRSSSETTQYDEGLCYTLIYSTVRNGSVKATPTSHLFTCAVRTCRLCTCIVSTVCLFTYVVRTSRLITCVVRTNHLITCVVRIGLISSVVSTSRLITCGVRKMV